MQEDITKLIVGIRHPAYYDSYGDWEKWRLAYKGGDRFKERYLQKCSERETTADFNIRKAISYVPAFAKAAINDIKNSIFQRVVDITRVEGTDSYQSSILGEKGGVDRHGSDMNSFIGRKILPELLPIGKVGIFIDRARQKQGKTYADTRRNAPYLYIYKAEDILSWSVSQESESDFTAVLLRDCVYETVGNFGLISGYTERYRHVYINDKGFVNVDFYDTLGEVKESITLKLKKIPFVVMELTQSLMTDVADYQISLLNLASSDMNYATKSNSPFYVEEASPHQMMASLIQQNTSSDGTTLDAAIAKSSEIEVGSVTGRRYEKGANPPQFINPSSEPLSISMEKQEQLKAEIRLLVNLSLSDVQPKMASASSKAMDMAGLESGLSYIGLEIQHGERLIAEHWAAYEASKSTATIKYPERYNLKSDEDRRKDAESYKGLLLSVPSKTYQKAIARKIARLLIGAEISNRELEAIYSEINTAKALVSDPAVVNLDVQDGILSRKTAAEIRQYPDGEANAASEEFHDRTLALAEAQAAKQGPAAVGDNPAARGIPDMSANPKADAKAEKANADGSKKPVRGGGK